MEQFEQHIEALIRNDWVSTAVAVVIMVVATALLARFVTRFLRHVLQMDGTHLPSSSIFVNIGRAAIWILGICIILSTCFNIDVSAAIAALGIGGIAVSLGFQDTISNLIGGLQVSLMRIVKPGDNIEVGSVSGVVKDVTWRHTTITNAKGQEIIVPNSIINKTALIHLPPANQVSVPFVVATDGADLDAVARAIEGAATEAACEVGTLTKKPEVSFSEIVDAGFKGAVVFRMADSRDGMKAVDAVLRAIASLTRPQQEEKDSDAHRNQDRT